MQVDRQLIQSLIRDMKRKDDLDRQVMLAFARNDLSARILYREQAEMVQKGIDTALVKVLKSGITEQQVIQYLYNKE